LWLASPAGSLLSTLIATMTILIWAATAALFAVIAVTGRPVASAAATLSVAAFPVLLVLDFVTALVTLISRAGRPGPARRSRAARPSTARPRASRTIRRVVRRLDGSALLTSLPRPVGRTLAAAAWLTVLAYAWLAWSGVMYWSESVKPTTTLGQLLVVTLLMVHALVWCGAACKRLNRNRSAARIWS
jgi:hypothetical protein